MSFGDASSATASSPVRCGTPVPCYARYLREFALTFLYAALAEVSCTLSGPSRLNSCLKLLHGGRYRLAFCPFMFVQPENNYLYPLWLDSICEPCRISKSTFQRFTSCSFTCSDRPIYWFGCSRPLYVRTRYTVPRPPGLLVLCISLGHCL